MGRVRYTSLKGATVSETVFKPIFHAVWRYFENKKQLHVIKDQLHESKWGTQRRNLCADQIKNELRSKFLYFILCISNLIMATSF